MAEFSGKLAVDLGQTQALSSLDMVYLGDKIYRDFRSCVCTKQ